MMSCWPWLMALVTWSDIVRLCSLSVIVVHLTIYDNGLLVSYNVYYSCCTNKLVATGINKTPSLTPLYGLTAGQ